MAFDWKALLRTVAPALATAAGGPLAGVAVKEIGDRLLGKPDATEADVAAALAGATPETLIKLREIDAAFNAKMVDAGIKLEEIAAGDRDSARRREVETKDWTPRILAAIVVSAWAVIQWHILTDVVPKEMRELAARALGTLDMALGMVLAYYFGSSAGSARKTELLKGNSR